MDHRSPCHSRSQPEASGKGGGAFLDISEPSAIPAFSLQWLEWICIGAMCSHFVNIVWIRILSPRKGRLIITEPVIQFALPIFLWMSFHSSCFLSSQRVLFTHSLVIHQVLLWKSSLTFSSSWIYHYCLHPERPTAHTAPRTTTRGTGAPDPRLWLGGWASALLPSRISRVISFVCSFRMPQDWTGTSTLQFSFLCALPSLCVSFSA